MNAPQSQHQLQRQQKENTNSERQRESTVAQLFRNQANKVSRLLDRKLRNIEDAQDATQEVFLRLWRHEREGLLKDEANAYLHSVAHTIAIDFQRRRRSHAADLHDPLDADQAHGPAVTADETLHWRQGVDRLIDSLHTLPDLTQQIFILYHFESLGYSEIAHRLGVSSRTVERHMVSAIEFCRTRLGEYL